MILPSIIIFFWAGFAYTGEMALLDFSETEQNALAHDLPDHFWDQIISYANFEDPTIYKNISEVNHQFYRVSNSPLENYRTTIENKEFKAYEKLMRLHAILPNTSLVCFGKEMRLRLEDFAYEFYNRSGKPFKETLQIFKETLQLLEEKKQIIETSNLGLHRKKLELQLNRTNRDDTMELEKEDLDKLEKKAKELELSSSFFQAIDKLRSKFQENIENFSKDSVEISQKMQEIWAEHEHEILKLKTLEDIKSLKRKIKEDCKALGLMNPFYGLYRYNNDFILLEKFVDLKQRQMTRKIP